MTRLTVCVYTRPMNIDLDTFQNQAAAVNRALSVAGVAATFSGSLALTAELVRAGLLPNGCVPEYGKYSHDDLVNACFASVTIMDYIKADQKIKAIKELRALSGSGLREAKDACEDYRLASYYPPRNY